MHRERERERERESDGRRNKAETKGNRRRFEEVQKGRVSKTIKGTDLSSLGLVVETNLSKQE